MPLEMTLIGEEKILDLTADERSCYEQMLQTITKSCASIKLNIKIQIWIK